MEEQQIKHIIEGAIMAAGNPLSLDRLLLLFDEEERPARQELKDLLATMQEDYADRSFELKELATGFVFQVRQQQAPWIGKLWEEKPARYSRALLETLAIIAYRQPVTRADVEDIRGVAVSSSIMKTLVEREWVKVIGHRDVPGKPAIYGSTKEFLDYFNLKSLDELPTLQEIKDLDSMAEQLDPQMQLDVDAEEQTEEIVASAVQNNTDELVAELDEMLASADDKGVIKHIKEAVEGNIPDSVHEELVKEEAEAEVVAEIIDVIDNLITDVEHEEEVFVPKAEEASLVTEMIDLIVETTELPPLEELIDAEPSAEQAASVHETVEAIIENAEADLEIID
jgi:segregation and condensation protein B